MIYPLSCFLVVAKVAMELTINTDLSSTGTRSESTFSNNVGGPVKVLDFYV